MHKGTKYSLMNSDSDSETHSFNSDLSAPPIAVRPRPRTTKCCPVYRRLQTVNTFVLGLSIFMILWYLKDLIVDHFDRETSDYLGLGAAGIYFGLGSYACWYSFQMQKKAEAEEARTLVELDDEEQVRISFSENRMSTFPPDSSSPVSDNKNKNNTSSSSRDMNHV